MKHVSCSFSSVCGCIVGICWRWVSWVSLEIFGVCLSVKCFRGRPDEAIAQLRERFRLDLNDRACREYVYSLVDNSIENWRTDWYDRYQRYFVGVL